MAGRMSLSLIDYLSLRSERKLEAPYNIFENEMNIPQAQAFSSAFEVFRSQGDVQHHIEQSQSNENLNIQYDNQILVARTKTVLL